MTFEDIVGPTRSAAKAGEVCVSLIQVAVILVVVILAMQVGGAWRQR